MDGNFLYFCADSVAAVFFLMPRWRSDAVSSGQIINAPTEVSSGHMAFSAGVLEFEQSRAPSSFISRKGAMISSDKFIEHSATQAIERCHSVAEVAQRSRGGPDSSAWLQA